MYILLNTWIPSNPSFLKPWYRHHPVGQEGRWKSQGVAPWCAVLPNQITDYRLQWAPLTVQCTMKTVSRYHEGSAVSALMWWSRCPLPSGVICWTWTVVCPVFCIFTGAHHMVCSRDMVMDCLVWSTKYMNNGELIEKHNIFFFIQSL